MEFPKHSAAAMSAERFTLGGGQMNLSARIPNLV